MLRGRLVALADALRAELVHELLPPRRRLRVCDLGLAVALALLDQLLLQPRHLPVHQPLRVRHLHLQRPHLRLQLLPRLHSRVRRAARILRERLPVLLVLLQPPSLRVQLPDQRRVLPPQRQQLLLRRRTALLRAGEPLARRPLGRRRLLRRADELRGGRGGLGLGLLAAALRGVELAGEVEGAVVERRRLARVLPLPLAHLPLRRRQLPLQVGRLRVEGLLAAGGRRHLRVGDGLVRRRLALRAVERGGQRGALLLQLVCAELLGGGLLGGGLQGGLRAPEVSLVGVDDGGELGDTGLELLAGLVLELALHEGHLLVAVDNLDLHVLDALVEGLQRTLALGKLLLLALQRNLQVLVLLHPLLLLALRRLLLRVLEGRNRQVLHAVRLLHLLCGRLLRLLLHLLFDVLRLLDHGLLVLLELLLLLLRTLQRVVEHGAGPLVVALVLHTRAHLRQLGLLFLKGVLQLQHVLLHLCEHQHLCAQLLVLHPDLVHLALQHDVRPLHLVHLLVQVRLLLQQLVHTPPALLVVLLQLLADLGHAEDLVLPVVQLAPQVLDLLQRVVRRVRQRLPRVAAADARARVAQRGQRAGAAQADGSADVLLHLVQLVRDALGA